jgi:hypothetical protein
MTTPRISMPEILSSQAQKEVSHNDALRIIDALLQAGVTDRDLTDPPGSPANGAVYIPAATATGAWAGQEGKLAQWYASAWYFLTPKDGWSVWIIDEARRITYQGGIWDVEAASIGTASLSNQHLSDFAEDPATTTGLTWGYKGGRVRNDNAIIDVAAGTLALTASATNYVELTPAGSIAANTTGFTSGRIPLSVLTTDGSAITASTDKRAWLSAAGASGGGASIPDFDEDSATTTGLTWGYKAGIIRNNNVITHVAAGTLTLTASATNYVEVDSAGTVSFNTSGFTAGRIPLRQLTTDGSGITASTDKRGWLQFAADFKSDGSVPMTGTLSMQDNVVSRPELQDYAESRTAPASSAGTLTLDLTGGNIFEPTLTENVTVSIANPPASGKGGSFTLILRQDGTGGWAVTWPSSVKWAGGTAPTLTTAASAVDVLTFLTTDAGATWFGFLAGADIK